LILGPLFSLAGSRWMGLLLWWKPFDAADLATVEALIAEGKVKPAIDRRYPLTEVAAALHWVDDGHSRGKVLVINESTSQ
jgi:NADPH:quinone reductase-like Zn-dependent oxidoreductase